MKKTAKFALVKTIPIFLGYIFLGIAFGLLLQKSGLGVLWAFLISALVYAGSMQFALVGILTGGLSYITTAVMTLFINSRHAFYGLTFIERFKEMKKEYPDGRDILPALLHGPPGGFYGQGMEAGHLLCLPV